MVRNFYVTREEVYKAADFKGSIIDAKYIDSAIQAASRSIDSLVNRRFFPVIATKYFSAPSGTVLWFNTPDELISASLVTSGGVTIPPADYFLEDVNYGPPFNRLELDLGSSSSFNTENTTQRQVAITGTWGYDYSTRQVTTLSSSPTSSTAFVDVADSSVVGIGNILVVGTEYLEVTEKQLIDTAQNTSALNSSKNDATITGVSSVNVGEIIQIDSEQMKVVSVTGTTLTVERAFGGTTLAVHHNGTDIYAYRRLVVSRGVNGSTAASHTSGDSVFVIEFPADIVELCLAESVNIVQQRTAGYGRTIGSGENLREAKGAAIAQMRSAVKRAYGRYRVA